MGRELGWLVGFWLGLLLSLEMSSMYSRSTYTGRYRKVDNESA